MSHFIFSRGGEPFDKRAVSTDPACIDFVSEPRKVWTCAPDALRDPSLSKCRNFFYVDQDVPVGWEWSLSGRRVRYQCPECRINRNQPTQPVEVVEVGFTQEGEPCQNA